MITPTCTPRRERVRYFIMIPQWSSSWAIQSGPYLSTFVCHHASYSGRRFLNVWVRFGLQRSHIWWWMISCHPIFDLPYIWCHIGAYSVSNEIHGSSWSCTIVPTYEIHIETRTCSLFYHDPPVEPFLSHSVWPTFFGIRMSSYLPFWGTPFLFVSLIQLWTWMTRTTHSMMDDLRPFDFFDLSHTWFHTGAYSFFSWDLWISIDSHDHPQLRDACWVDDLTSLCLDSLMEPFLSHLVGPIFSDVVMIWSGPYFLMLSWFSLSLFQTISMDWEL